MFCFYFSELNIIKDLDKCWFVDKEHQPQIPGSWFLGIDFFSHVQTSTQVTIWFTYENMVLYWIT